MFSPSDNFRRFHKEAAKELRPTVQQPFFLTGCNFAMSQMAFDGASAEQLAGARTFISKLGQLGEAPEEPTKLPVKTLAMDAPDYLPGKKKPEEEKKGKKK